MFNMSTDKNKTLILGITAKKCYCQNIVLSTSEHLLLLNMYVIMFR